MTNDNSMMIAAGTGSIGQYGSSNPAVMAFLQASFSLEGMGLNQGLANAIDAQIQSIGSALGKGSGVSL